MFKKIEIGDVVKFSTLDEYKMFFWIHPEYSFGKSVCFTADTKYVASSSKEVNWLDKSPHQAVAVTTYKMPKCDPWPAGYEPVFDLNAIRSAGMKYYSKSGSSWCDIESPGGKVMSDYLYIQPSNGCVEPKILRQKHRKQRVADIAEAMIDALEELA